MLHVLLEEEDVVLLPPDDDSEDGLETEDRILLTLSVMSESVTRIQLNLSFPSRARLLLREENNWRDSFVDRNNRVFFTDSCGKSFYQIEEDTDILSVICWSEKRHISYVQRTHRHRKVSTGLSPSKIPAWLDSNHVGCNDIERYFLCNLFEDRWINRRNFIWYDKCCSCPVESS